MKTYTENAIKFLGMNPEKIAVIEGIELYEHPIKGDLSTLIAINNDGKLKRTSFYDCPNNNEEIEALVEETK